jgi:hypothetical protein
MKGGEAPAAAPGADSVPPPSEAESAPAFSPAIHDPHRASFFCSQRDDPNRPETSAGVDLGFDRAFENKTLPNSLKPSCATFSRSEEPLFPSPICQAGQFYCWEQKQMMQSTYTEPAGGVVEPSVSGVSWAAVAAGAVASCALTLVLLSLGTGLGLSAVSPWGDAGVSTTTFKIGTGLYFIVMAMISSAIGGYIAGRLRTKWTGVHTDEVYFRDTAHGFLAWAFASVLGAVLLASPASSLIGGAASGATQAAAGAAQSSPMDGYVDTLLRPDTAQPSANPQDSRGELVRLFTTSFHNGSDLAPADRTYVAKVVSARTGLAQPEAEKRVTEVTNQVKSDLDKARKNAARLALWLTASLIIGAFSASLAATEGGGLRDGTWGNKSLRVRTNPT